MSHLPRKSVTYAGFELIARQFHILLKYARQTESRWPNAIRFLYTSFGVVRLGDCLFCDCRLTVFTKVGQYARNYALIVGHRAEHK